MQTNLNQHAIKIGFFAVILYVICLVWRIPLQITDEAVIALHMTSLKALFPGFQGYDVMSVLWGGVLSFVYGFLASQVFHRLHKNCCEPKS